MIRPGAARACPGLALQQVALPLGIRLAGVVPEAREVGEVAASKRLCPPARKRGNVAQVVDEELALAVVVGRVSEEWLSSRGLLYACVAHGYTPSADPPPLDGSERKHMPLTDPETLISDGLASRVPGRGVGGEEEGWT